MMKEYLKKYLEEYLLLDTSKKFKCLNPAHLDEKPSMSYKDMKIHCFSCGISMDIFDVVLMNECICGKSDAQSFLLCKKWIENWLNIPSISKKKSKLDKILDKHLYDQQKKIISRMYKCFEYLYSDEKYIEVISRYGKYSNKKKYNYGRQLLPEMEGKVKELKLQISDKDLKKIYLLRKFNKHLASAARGSKVYEEKKGKEVREKLLNLFEKIDEILIDLDELGVEIDKLETVSIFDYLKKNIEVEVLK